MQILYRGIPVSYEKEKLLEELEAAVSNWDVDGVRLALGKGADLDDYNQIIQLAVLRGEPTVVSLLLEAPSATQHTKNMALLFAAQKRSMEMTKHMLALGADPSCGNAFRVAVMAGSKEVADYLFDVSDSSEEMLDFTMFLAARGVQLGMVEYVMQKGGRDKKGDALDIAADYGANHIVEFLLENIDYEQKALDRALSSALSSSHATATTLAKLLEHGAEASSLRSKALNHARSSGKTRGLSLVKEWQKFEKWHEAGTHFSRLVKQRNNDKAKIRQVRQRQIKQLSR